MRIKQLHTFIGLTIFGLLVQSGLADISLTQRNGAQGRGTGPGHGRNRKAYLPPPVQAVQHNTEEYYSIQEEHAPSANQHQHQVKFQESNYGNARYQIFEVHNHYEPAPKHHNAAPQAVVRIKHINSGVAPNHNHINDDHLDISYLSFAAHDGPNGEQITIHEQLPPLPAAPPSVPQITSTVPAPFPSNYQHNFQSQHVSQAPKPFKVPDYFPPNREVTAVTNLPAQQLNREPFKGPDYLPPYKQGPTGSFDVSAPVGGVNYRAPDYLPPHQGVPTLAQQYLAPQIPQQQHTSNTHHTNHHNEYKGPDYLPPHQSESVQARANDAAYQVSSSASAVSGAYRGPDYLPPHGGSQVQQSQLQSFQQQQTPNLNVHHIEHQQQTASVSSVFKGPDYLPPHQGIPSQQHLPPQPFMGPDYLPPHQESASQQHLPQQPFKGPDYLPPHATNVATSHVEQQPLLPQTPQRAPGFLPPGYDFDNPEEKQQQQQFQQPQHQQHYDQQVQIQQSPLQYQEHVQVPAQFSPAAPTQGTLGTPGTLPPGYDFIKPDNAEQAIAELHGQAPPSHPQPQQEPEQQQLPQPNYQTYQQQQSLPQQPLPEQTFPQQPLQQQPLQQQPLQQQPLQQQPLQQQPLQQQPLQQQPLHQQSLQQQPLQQQPLQQQPLQQQPLQQQPLQQQHFIHSTSQQQQHLDVAVQPQIQVGNNNAAVPDIVYGQPKIATPPEGRSTYQADPAGYLPPHAEDQPQQQQAPPVNVPQYQQPQIAPQQPVQQYNSAPQQQQQFQQHQHMHSLSSYMTTVQPYERYGDVQFTVPPRRPFDKYGPPSATTPLPNLQQQQPFVDVAPMYRAPTTRPQAYAPTMTYTLNEQTKQQLQQFMPKEIQQQQQQLQQQQQHIAAAPSAGKIRTVQIVNPNAVRTLKVLETSDHAGVKTIKILGPSNESPMGEHRIVKVVSQSGADGHEDHVQTVKIYNDHQDVTIGGTATATAVGATGNNAYLPPAATVAVNKKRLVRDSQHLQAQPRRRIGGKGSNNRRYRQRF